MSKKISVILILISFIMLSAFCNAQKYYTVRSDQWQAVDDICQYAGVSGPSSNGPLTAAQLISALERAERVLGPSWPEIVKLKEELSADKGLLSDGISLLSLTPSINGELYYQSNPHETLQWGTTVIDPDAEWLIKDSLSRKPFFEMELEVGVLDFFYGRMVFSFIPVEYKTGIWDKGISHNIRGPFSQNFPYDSGISLGTDHVSLIAAKGRRSVGRGFTGNTAIGDVYDYQEYIKAGVISDLLSVILAVTNFDTSHDMTYINNPYMVLGSRFSGKKSLRYESSLEVRLFDRFAYSITMINLADTDGGIDVRAFNPFYILHNMFNFGEYGREVHESNNMMTMDFSLSPFRKWNMYFQFTMDQSQSKGEIETSMIDFGYVEPNAKGYLANISYVDRMGKGIIRIYGEFVYNSPALYLVENYYTPSGKITRTRYSGSEDKRCWAQDYLLGYYRASQDGDDVTFAGYKFGPDVIVGALGFRYFELDKITLDARLLYIAHGEKGRGTDVRNYVFYGIDSETTYNSPAPTGIVEHTAAISVELRYCPFRFVETYLGMSYSHKWNYMNNEGIVARNFLLSVGLTIKTNLRDLVNSVSKGI